MLRILYVDNDTRHLQAAWLYFRDKSHLLQEATNADQAVRFLANQPFDVVIANMALAPETGLELLARAKILCPDVRRVLALPVRGATAANTDAPDAPYDLVVPRPFAEHEWAALLERLCAPAGSPPAVKASHGGPSGREKGRPLKEQLFMANSTSELKRLREFVCETLEQGGVPGALRSQVILAVDEAVSNLVLNAYEPGRRDTISLTCEVTPEAIHVVIRDSGRPRAIPEVEPSQLSSLLKRGERSQLGVYLVRTLMDEVEAVYREGARNELRMKKRLANETAPRLASGGPVQFMAG